MIRKDRSDIPVVDENGGTIDNTSIAIDKTIRSLFKTFCEMNDISLYKMTNLIMTDFIMKASLSEDLELFLAEYFKGEKDYIKILRDNKEKKMARLNSINPRRAITVKMKVNQAIWNDFCRNAFHRRKKQENDFTTAIMNHINNTCMERDYRK